MAQWQPHQQKILASLHNYDELLLGGNRGGGKTFILLGAFLKHLQLAGPKARYCRGVIFRQTYQEVTDLADSALDMYAGYATRKGSSPVKFTFGCGAEITFAYLKDGKSVSAYKGREFTFLGIDEVTHIAEEHTLLQLLGSLRNPHGIRRQILLTANPDGPGLGWVRKRYVEPNYPQMYSEREVAARKEDEDVPGSGKRIYRTGCIFVSVEDNKVLLNNDPGYLDTLRELNRVNPQLGASWYKNDWFSNAYGAFAGAFDERHNVIDVSGEIPNVFLVKGYDQGTASPSCVHWAAIARSQTRVPISTPSGDIVTRDVPAGSVIFLHELYTCQPHNHNEGLRYTEEQMVDLIKQEEEPFKSVYTNILPGEADHNLWETTDDHKRRIDVHTNKGLTWNQAHKARISGWDRMRTMLGKAHKPNPDGPVMLIDRSCTHLIRQLGSAQYVRVNVSEINDGKKYDADIRKADDHALDAARYILMRDSQSLSGGRVRSAPGGSSNNPFGRIFRI